MDNNGEQVYTALEESNSFARCCLGKCHSWDFHLIDKNHREVLKISRPSRSSSCLFPCCLQVIIFTKKTNKFLKFMF